MKPASDSLGKEMTAPKTNRDFDWYVRLFVACMGEILLFQLLSAVIGYYSYPVFVPNVGESIAYFSPPIFPWFTLLVVIVFIAPLIFSLVLSKKDVDLENLRIVPPFYVSIVGASYAGIFLAGIPVINHMFNSAFIANQGAVYLIGAMMLMFIVLAAKLEDSVAVAILGRTAERQSIYFQKLRVHSTIEEVRTKLTTPEYADNLFLKMNVGGDAQKGYILKTLRGFSFITKIGLYVDEGDPKCTVVKMAYYQKSAYSLSLTKYFIEEAKRQSIYLIEILQDRAPNMKVDVVIPLNNTVHDLFINEVIDDLRGFYVQTKKAPRVSILLVGTVVALAGLTVGLFLSKLPEEAFLATGAIDALILVVAVMDYLRKGR